MMAVVGCRMRNHVLKGGQDGDRGGARNIFR
jgi:hypothetical protein